MGDFFEQMVGAPNKNGPKSLPSVKQKEGSWGNHFWILFPLRDFFLPNPSQPLTCDPPPVFRLVEPAGRSRSRSARGQVRHEHGAAGAALGDHEGSGAGDRHVLQGPCRAADGMGHVLQICFCWFPLLALKGIDFTTGNMSFFILLNLCFSFPCWF